MPDTKIWPFPGHLVQAGAIEDLLSRFNRHLAKAGYLAVGGQIVDTTVVAAPRQRNADAEKVYDNGTAYKRDISFPSLAVRTKIRSISGMASSAAGRYACRRL